MIYIIKLIYQLGKLLFITLLALFYNFKGYFKNNNIGIVSATIPYETVVKYNKKIPKGVTNTIKEGINGLVYKDEKKKVTIVLEEKVNKVVEIGTGKQPNYKGVLTAYAYNCNTCDLKGYTYCMTKEGNWHNLVTDGITYNDYQYGEVRILATDHRAFPCGTIIEINNSDYTNLLGIVLDTGSGMINAYNHGWNLIDMAYEDEKTLKIGTNQKTKFTVKRWGW